MQKTFPILQAHELLGAWTNRIIRGRYQQSLLGWLWALVQPIMAVAMYSVIFTQFVRVDTGNIPYPVFSYIAVVPWTLFSSSLQDMTISLVQNINLVTKVYFPREVLPVSAMLARMMDFVIAAIVFVVLLIIYHIQVSYIALLFFPVILLIQIFLILGIGMFAAAMNVFYRDVQSVLVLVTQLWFYASPIIYPVTLVPERYRFLYFLNPMAGILEAYRAIILSKSFPDTTLLIAGIEAVVILILGYWVFKKVEFQFADIV